MTIFDSVLIVRVNLLESKPYPVSTIERPTKIPTRIGWLIAMRVINENSYS